MDGSYQKINEAQPNYGGTDQSSTPPVQGAYPPGQPPTQSGYQSGPLPPGQGQYPGGQPPPPGQYPQQAGYTGGPTSQPQGEYPPQGGQPPPPGQYPQQAGYTGGPTSQPQGEYPPQGGQPPPQGQYPPQGGPPPPQGQYPPQQGYQSGPPPPQGQYPPQGGPPPPQGQYPPQQGYQGGPPPPQGQYPPQQGYQGGPPPPQGQYPPQGGPPPPQGQYPPQGGPPPPQGQYPPQQGYQSASPTVQSGQYGGYTTAQVTNTSGPLTAPAGPTAAGAPRSFPQGFQPPQIDGDTPEEEMPVPDRPPPQMNPVAGYEGAGFTAGDFFPPPTQFQSPVPAGPPETRGEIPEIAVWKEDDVRNALLDYIDGMRCYGKGTANDMVIKEILNTSAFHYKLETFTEGRQVNWEHDPYNMGMSIDGPEMGPAPTPWDIPIEIPEYFKKESLKVEVPHTAYVKACHKCGTEGVVPCKQCWGRGRRRCSWCHGDGVRHEATDPDNCDWCHGSGYRICQKCDSRGVIICSDCKGEGNLKFFLELKVKWNSHTEDFIKEDTPLPDELVKDVTGVIAFQENNMMVWPLTNFPQAEINEASTNLVKKHASNFPTERILQQRHTLRIIPVAEVKYEWKDTTSNFFLYGEERKVYAPDYPQTCCWGCAIL